MSRDKARKKMLSIVTNEKVVNKEIHFFIFLLYLHSNSWESRREMRCSAEIYWFL